MNWYHLTLFAHIVGVLGLFMALAVELASILGATRARTVEAVRAWSSTGKPLAVVFPLTSLLILAAGLTMTFGVWGWGQAWIDLSLALVILLSIIGATVNGAYMKRIAERAAVLENGPVPSDFRQELTHLINWIFIVTMPAIALGIVFLMVAKPGWLGSSITLLVALLVGVVLALALVRSSRTRASIWTESHDQEPSQTSEAVQEAAKL